MVIQLAMLFSPSLISSSPRRLYGKFSFQPLRSISPPSTIPAICVTTSAALKSSVYNRHLAATPLPSLATVRTQILTATTFLHSDRAYPPGRRPNPCGSIHSNPLHPTIFTVDRLFCWNAPHSLEAAANLDLILPPGLPDLILSAICFFYAPNTKSTYGMGILRFTEFCDKHDISEVDWMPASWPLLCTFIGQHQGTCSGNMIKTWLTGIYAWHVVPTCFFTFPKFKVQAKAPPPNQPYTCLPLLICDTYTTF